MEFCSLYSGSSGNCQFLKTEKTRILFDAGLSGKRIEQALISINEDPHEIEAIFITHEHVDHIQGAGVLSRRYDVPIYANKETWEAMETKLGKIKEHNIKIMDNDINFKDVFIHSFDVSHDAAKPVGYNIFWENKKVSLLTDTGCFNNTIKEKIKDSDLFLMETNHDVELLKVGSYPWPLKRRIMSDFGHLSNETAANLLTEVLTKGNEIVLLGHLSKENNFPELAYKTVADILVDEGFDITNGLQLEMTFRDKASRVFKL